MALVECDECGRTISHRAALCPGCGFPMQLNGGPLHRASAAGAVERVGRLVALGVDLDTLDGSSWTPLGRAAVAGFAEIVQSLLAAGANPNATRLGDAGPLHWAARHGRFDVVELLLDGGADVNARDAADGTPVEWGRCHSEKMVELLRSHSGRSGAELKQPLRDD